MTLPDVLAAVVLVLCVVFLVSLCTSDRKSWGWYR